jgi:DNA-binding NtrC family response regulator
VGQRRDLRGGWRGSRPHGTIDERTAERRASDAMSGDDATLRRPTLKREPAPAAAFSLVVVEGHDTGRAFALDPDQPGRVLLGQSPACEVRVVDREVSRRHAALESAGERLRITDLGSTNGTLVDGVAIVEALLKGGETVRVGSTVLRVERGAMATAAPLSASSFGRLLGASPAMRRLYPLCQRLAASDVPVILEGETGTGKEVLAESLHAMGPRAKGPFVVFDCTAVPPNLVESELFGHERGAFTGALSSRRGVREQAAGGTLFIDEIGDLEASLQPKLLRAIERSEVRRVGSERWIHTNIRILAATRRDLDHEVQAGRFRDDLFHRVAVTRIELPPLRRRHGDVRLLAKHFCKELGGDLRLLGGDLLAQWDEDAWPGNVRELRNAVARRLAIGDLPRELPTDAPPEPEAPAAVDVLTELLAKDLPLIAAREKLVAEFERRYVERLLAQNGGNVTRAAESSGVALRHFQRLRARAKR